MLAFEFDTARIGAIADEFDASEADLHKAFSRALRRTASTMRVSSQKKLRTELGVRTAAILRRRLHGFKLSKAGSRSSDLGSVRMWFGLNDLPVSAFKGRVRATATGASINGREVPGGFVGKRRGKRTILQRVGAARFPLREATIPIADEAGPVIDRAIFGEIEEVFFRNFAAEIRARTIYGVG